MEFFGGGKWRVVVLKNGRIALDKGLPVWEQHIPVSKVRMRSDLWEDDWLSMMNILAQIDVSAIRDMEIELPHHGRDEFSVADSETVRRFEDVYGMDHLGPLLGSGRFTALLSLRISIPRSGRLRRGSETIRYDKGAVFGLDINGSAHLARALISGQFTNLRMLFLPSCADAAEILRAVEAGHVSRLESFSISSTKFCSQSTLHQILGTVAECWCFKRLHYLQLSNVLFDRLDGWELFTQAVKSGKWPTITSLGIDSGALGIDMSSEELPESHFKIKKCLGEAEWLYMMDILSQIDVSGVRDMELELPDCTWDNPRIETLNSVFESDYGMDRLGPLLGSGRFGGLTTLRITITRSGRFGGARRLQTIASDRNQIDDNAVFGLNVSGSAHLARALKSGDFRVLKFLSLPACADIPEIVVEAGHLPQMVSFSIMSTKVCSQSNLGQVLDAVLEAVNLKSLHFLELFNVLPDGIGAWEVFSRAINSGKLPKIVGLNIDSGPLKIHLSSKSFHMFHVGIKKSLSEAEWLFMMDILARIDFSDIKEMSLELPACPGVEACNSVFESDYGMDRLGPLRGSGRFSGLALLSIKITRPGRFVGARKSETSAFDENQIDDNAVFGLNVGGSAHLARALKSGQFKNLSNLYLPGCADVIEILEALEAGHISKLRALSLTSTRVCSLSNVRKKLNALLEGRHLKLLTSLELSNGILDLMQSWEVLNKAMNSGKLLSISSLSIGMMSLKWGLSGIGMMSLKWGLSASVIGDGLVSVPQTLRIISEAKDDPAILDNGQSGTTVVILNNSGTGQFPALLALSVPTCQILGALKTGPLSRLRGLELCNGVLDGVDAWEALIRALNSGMLPNVTSLRLSQNALNRVNLADLVPLLLSNFLEILIIYDCWINSKQLWGLADAILNSPNTGLALKQLDVSHNLLGAGSDILLRDSGVDALVELANSDLLPQLQRLDLSMNDGSPEALIRLMKSVEMRHLPNLESVYWGSNPVSDEVGEAMFRAYSENEDITTEFDMDWNQVKDPSVRIKAKECKQRNIRINALKKQHKELQEDPVGLTSAKVFFGGWQEVGKTTLRTALCGNLKFKKNVWNRKLKRPIVSRTRGIELSQIEQAGVALTLWDLAGQEDYHVLHGTFFPDLGLTHGTTFVLVFRADLGGDVEKDLLYWLRFAASSSQKFVKRHVVIVLNCFEGKQCAENDRILLEGWLQNYRAVFEDFLDIHTDPFEMDVRFPALVQPLKNHLFERTQILLEKVKVPKVCLELQKKLNEWSQGDNNSLPILTWQAFEARMGRQTNGKDFKAAALYLHEIGWIIYFDHKERSVVVLDPSWLCSKVVGELLLPQNILEELEQKKGASDGIRRQVGFNGSMDTCIFEAYLQGKLVEGTTIDDVISVLERLGVCFRKGRKEKSKLFFPALNQQDNYVLTAWGRQRSGGQVVGRRLAVEENHWSAIPVTVFRHLQVELSKDLNFGGSDDSEYIAGKSFSTFKVGALVALIEFNVDHLDPANDRIDILVKNTTPIQDSMNPTLEQVGLICRMMEEVQKLCCTYCPGLKYDIKVIQPWSTLDDTPKMSVRGIMALQEIKGFLMEDHPYRGPYLSWQVEGKQVKMESYLSESELELVLKIKTEMKVTSEVNRRTDAVRVDSDVLPWEAIQQIGKQEMQEEHFWADISSGAVEENEEPEFASELFADMDDDILSESASEIEDDRRGILAGDPLQEVEEGEEENRQSALDLVKERAPVEDQNCGHGGVTNEILLAELREICRVEMRRFLERMEELHFDTSQHRDEGTTKLLMKAEELLLKVEAHYSFSIQEQEKSVPRFMILREKNSSGVWSSFKKAIKKPFQEDFLLHFLCESRFDDGNLHWVKDQKGLKLSKNSVVAEKLSEAEPWLQWSFYVATILGRVTLNIFLPPFGSLIPNVSATSTTEQDKIENTGVKMLQTDEEIYSGNSGSTEKLRRLRERLIAEGDLGSEELLTDVKMKLMAESVGHALMKENGMPKFLERTRLRRVLVLINGHVKWICVDCLKQYGEERVRDITPSC